MSTRPGTVSKILWHFTGGPLWDNALNKQRTELKPATDAYSALSSILSSCQLRLGSYHEIVKVILKEKRRRNFETKKLEILKDVPTHIRSSAVCCVADIPIQHLSFHSKRYGKIAIGFHRESIIKAGFNPVLYSLENTQLLNSLYQGYSAVSEMFIPYAISAKDDLESELESLSEVYEHNIDTSNLDMQLWCIEHSQDNALRSFETLLAYVKSFDDTELDSIYCEREWRSVSNFDFTLDDIAMIVLPRNQEGQNFHEEFCKTTSLPRSVTIACWEDLIEH